MPGFTADNLVPPDQVNLKTIRPFKKGEFLDNQDGTRSTERTMSFNIEGEEVVMPSLWMTPDGPVDLSRSPEAMIRSVIEFEKRSKKRFPRFKTVQEADEFSINRTDRGAVSIGTLEK